MISGKNLKKSFGGMQVLKGINTEIDKGEVICVIGPSGSGKSTFLRCLNMLERPSGGQIIFEGDDLTDKKIDLDLHRQKMGMVFQQFNLFPHMTVMKNLTVAPMMLKKVPEEQAKAKALELLGRVGLADRANSYPNQLSGGQKQRVAIVRALCTHPEILLFDEVTAALDPEMVREVLDVIVNLADQGKTMIIVTHEMSFARAVADRIILLEDRRILEESDPETFFTSPKTEQAQKFLRTFEFNRNNKAEA